MSGSSGPEKKSSFGYVRDFWRFIRPYKRPLRIVYVLYFINSVLNLLPALSVRFYIDLVLLEHDAGFLWFTLPAYLHHGAPDKIAVSLVYGAAMVVLIVLANIIGVVMWRKNAKNVEKVVFDIRVELHNHIEKLSLRFFQNERVGAIMTRAVGDVANVSELLKNSFNISYALVQFVLTPFIMIALSPLLFLVVLVPLPLIAYAFYSIRIRLKPMYRMQRENEEIINSRIHEMVSGIREIKAFNMGDAASDAYREINMKFYTIQNRIMKVFSFNHQLQYGSKDLAIILIAVAGGFMSLYGTAGVTVGTISTFMILTGYLFAPVSQFVSFFDQIQRGLVSLERIVSFLSVLPDIKDSKSARVLRREDLKGEVAYHNVSFSYESGVPVLDRVSFRACAGKNIALVGSTGSGKSTLVSLLLRFYDPASGSITLDGTDIRSLTQESLRRNIGIVFQDPFLFYGTIRDNLLFASPRRSEEELVRACIAANIYDTIRELPAGFDTFIGERGTKLSGGQKQRLALARVFLKDPRIVVLDEATASVDVITEGLIRESIDKVLAGRTAIIIAHRLSTVRNCDLIVVIETGKVAESGTHDELIARRGVYYEMCMNNVLQSEGDNG